MIEVNMLQFVVVLVKKGYSTTSIDVWCQNCNFCELFKNGSLITVVKSVNSDGYIENHHWMFNTFIKTKKRHVSFLRTTFVWVFHLPIALSFSLPLDLTVATTTCGEPPWASTSRKVFHVNLCKLQITTDLTENHKFSSHRAIKPTSHGSSAKLSTLRCEVPLWSCLHTVKPLSRVSSLPMVGTLHLYKDLLTCF